MPKLQVITVGGSYFPTWQIPLHTSKQSIKIASTFRTMEKIFNGSGREAGSSPMWDFVDPSDRTVSSTSTSSYSSTSHVGRYRFPTKDVFAPGKYGQKEWDGPPRWKLQGKFDKWCMHLHEALQECDDVKSSRLSEILVQTKGGYQNSFLFAEK